MRSRDILMLSGTALLGQRLRSMLTILAIAIGIAAVTMLTSIGEGIHFYVLDKFTQFGTNIIKLKPGKTTTKGHAGSILNSVRPITLEDMEAVQVVSGIKAAMPLITGNGNVESATLKRRTTIIGVNHLLPEVWQIKITRGRFLPTEDLHQTRAFAVLGSHTAKELFPRTNPLGKRIRIAGEPFRVIGVLESKGEFLGIDLDDTIYVPAIRGMEMFNRAGLMEVNLLYEEKSSPDIIIPKVRRIMMKRHGEEDFSLITQEDMLDNLGSILNVLTLAASALGAISLVVGGIGIATILTISVTERTSEIGVMVALGAKSEQVQLIFLSEALVLSAIGGLVGILIGIGGAELLMVTVPDLPVNITWNFILLAELLSLVVGLISGVAPSRQAARMDPIRALRSH